MFKELLKGTIHKPLQLVQLGYIGPIGRIRERIDIPLQVRLAGQIFVDQFAQMVVTGDCSIQHRVHPVVELELRLTPQSHQPLSRIHFSYAATLRLPMAMGWDRLLRSKCSIHTGIVAAAMLRE